MRVSLRSVLAAIACSGAIVATLPAHAGAPPALDVRIVTDEADAVLAILAKRKADAPVTDADWQRLFSSEGYRRLEERETSMNRPFEQSDFRAFVLSEAILEQAAALDETLEKWKRMNAGGAARSLLAWLPKDARIRAKIYPVIKPRDNSFVFDVKEDPAIFLYLDPSISVDKFENTLAHELHHIGYGTSCPSSETSAGIESMPENVRSVVTWIGAFGEGFAMLAAAGGTQIHPHAVSSAAERERWDRDVANFNSDLAKVERFFLDVLEMKLTGDDIRTKAFSFFGTQGPWYTVGWKMAVVIEETFGRDRLIESFCDPRLLLATFNEAAAKRSDGPDEPLRLWSESMIAGITEHHVAGPSQALRFQ